MTERTRTVVSVTDEHLRILLAVQEDRLTVNSHGRYEIEGEERPDRKSREQLRSRGLIVHHFESGRGSHWRLTAKGRATLEKEIQSRVAAGKEAVKQLQEAEGLSFAEAYGFYTRSLSEGKS